MSEFIFGPHDGLGFWDDRIDAMVMEFNPRMFVGPDRKRKPVRFVSLELKYRQEPIDDSIYHNWKGECPALGIICIKPDLEQCMVELRHNVENVARRLLTPHHTNIGKHYEAGQLASERDLNDEVIVELDDLEVDDE